MTELQLLLPGGPSGLLLSLTILFVRAVAAIGAAGDGADDAVMSGIVTGDAANHGAFQAALGVGGSSSGQGCDGEEGGKGFHGGVLRKKCRGHNGQRRHQFRFAGFPQAVRHPEATRGRIQTPADLLSSRCAASFNRAPGRIRMAKGQMRSNKEKKKPKADKNLKKGGAAPSPFSSGKTPAGQSPNSKKS